nr:MAG TPA: hypothetical protein [Microviridae sp.]
MALRVCVVLLLAVPVMLLSSSKFPVASVLAVVFRDRVNGRIVVCLSLNIISQVTL